MDSEQTNAPWLVAAWPGMGNVAMIGAGFLVRQLRMTPIAELEAHRHFDIQHVEVKHGLMTPPRFPRSTFYRSTNTTGRQLLVFLGEAQPSTETYAFAHTMLEKALALGASRVMTFASMASQLHPSQAASVWGAATRKEDLDELERHEVAPLEDGQIAGLNGVLLGAAAERDLPGACLLGEIPFYAAGVPNPKAAKAVLDVFAPMAGIEIDLDPLARDAETVDNALIEMLEKMQREQGDEDGPEFPTAFEIVEPEEGEETKEPEGPRLDSADRARLERMFDAAREDRSKAMSLKRELDRLGVFEQYEDRFLDLFKRAE